MAAAPPTTPSAPRLFGRFELRQMLGRSAASSTWLAWDPRAQHDLLLCVPGCLALWFPQPFIALAQLDPAQAHKVQAYTRPEAIALPAR